MKTFIQIFKKAMGLPLLVWYAIFYAWSLINLYYNSRPVKELEGLENVFVVLDLIGLILRMWFAGYCFCVAARMASSKVKPLYPLGLYESFKMGVHIVCRLVFVCLPVVAVFEATDWMDWMHEPAAGEFFDAFLFCYIAFFIIPFLVFFSANAEKLPYLFTWDFFKKNFDYCLSFLMLSYVSFFFWDVLEDVFFDWFPSYLDSFTWKERAALILYRFLYIYLVMFNAILLGYFAGKTKEADVKVLPEAEEPIKEENAAVVFPSKRVVKKQPQKKTTSAAKSTKAKAPATRKKVVRKTTKAKTAKK